MRNSNKLIRVLEAERKRGLESFKLSIKVSKKKKEKKEKHQEVN